VGVFGDVQVAAGGPAEVQIGRLREWRDDSINQGPLRIEDFNRAATPVGGQKIAVDVKIDSVGAAAVLLGGAAGVAPAQVVILGGGTAGFSACSVALGMGAQVVLLDINRAVLDRAQRAFTERLTVRVSGGDVIEKLVQEASLVIGTVLIPGARAPRLVTRDMIKKMKKGTAVVDVSIDQGGCIETSRPTTHSAPFYIEEGIVHCCITNLPGTVPLTSTHALSAASLPFGLELADKGLAKVVAENPALAKGVNLFKGAVTCRLVAEAFGLPCEPL
jgi:alanine dehydrogenase